MFLNDAIVVDTVVKMLIELSRVISSKNDGFFL